MIGWAGEAIQTDRTVLTTQTGQASPNDPDGSGEIDDPDGPGDLMTHTGRACLTSLIGWSSPTTTKRDWQPRRVGWTRRQRQNKLT
ncbi:hypothetical protein DEO72_LG11g2699 [Vigna unguiculata]|uniref:Uncharacterized protein n=1 Tax=Vigna unguiculata TaxID=3917 RepID=A0A4D6NV68_VIGUN|nr:hypothetical protein DEO72_LG11g2699 [Vigna unguiculata]